ncbi:MULTISPECIES: hypothetical protein [unclassified Bradyrhizobium]|uniref:hypothetical protein n=1 Tax=unclassified Bradyrhizobium TaxID=2631580 RepID=UPI002479DD6C|nr:MULTISPECIES: hypothetical protein [unclassified Bradyrhizobium]WGR73221.1 hypothetical protein MTX24_10500 [Bradyrhizobium sp. ISRA426]WGR78060.1 hypothetical protein MTX21_35470 [Bradyrhizobium sp. ISRA430]WGR88461.1 hypothetical protein MTX25_10510 [Bradyrhizobium sp. ISRA432]
MKPIRIYCGICGVRAFRGSDVVEIPERACKEVVSTIRIDQGSELVSRNLD